VLRRAGFNGLVTYGADTIIHQVAQEEDFQGMILGVWDPTNPEEMHIAKEAAQYDVAIGYVVGNEGLDRRYDYTTLKAAMDELRQATGKPVTTTEEWGDYLNPQVMNLGDWVFPNVHPYWHGITHPIQAIEWTEERFRELSAQTDKLVVFKEVGLPSSGDDRLNEAKQAEYYHLLQDTSVTFVYFEAFDQPWKDWAPVEPHWGLFRQDRSPKQVVQYVCKSPSPSSGPYGVVQDLAYDPPEDLDAIVDLMARAGIQYVRMDFRWYLIELENDIWNFEVHDHIVQTLENRGIQIVGLLDDVPTWANGQSGPWSGTYPPDNPEDWSDYVFHVVDHYKNRVTYWELWNEENIAQYFRPRPDADQYVQLLQAGYEAAKQANPDAVILLGGLAGNGVNMGWEPSESQNFLQKIYDSGGRAYFDIVNIHPYVHPITSTYGLPAGIEGLRNAIEATRSVMIANGDDKPIWITEIGWSTATNAWNQPTVSEAEVATWLEEVYTSRQNLNVEKIFWYNFRDSGPNPDEVEHNFGLVRRDLTPKPAYWKYRALTTSNVPSIFEENAYSHLYEVMDKYESGDALRLLDSYEATPTWDDGDMAWVYDNALVMLALIARGAEEDWARAKVLADSLIYAQSNDPDFSDGRLRDAYHASTFIGQDGKAQVAAPGSGVGNMAFAILALLRYWEAKGGDDYLGGATRLGQWICDHTYDTRGPGGYTGGYDGVPPDQTRHRWKATEHNIDAYAAFMKLYEATRDSAWLRRAMHAKSFVQAMWDEAGGHFWTGTLNDGASINPSPIPEDAQSWGLMALGEVNKYGAGITWAENNLLVDPCPGCETYKGFRFSDRGAGCWWEGAAHTVIAFQIKGEGDKADEFLEVLRQVQTTVLNNNGKGIVSACPGGADSGYGGVYPNALHIGATAWYLFAERHHNPFWGIGTDEPIPYDGLDGNLLETIARDTWNYLSSDWATDNHLPWSWRSNRMSGGDYANPAEIGFYMLSYIGAYEMREDWSPSWEEVEAEVGATLDQLEAWQSGTQSYQPHGPNSYNNSAFYQAYWINWNPPVVGAGNYDHQVPSIDNAWLAASLITIREYAEANDKPGLAQKVNYVLEDMDFTIWYHPGEHMFSWGTTNDPQGGGLISYYSNENRITNFVARALGQLSRDEFEESLRVLIQNPGTYDRGTEDPSDDIIIEKVAWDGSYFTYVAPALFIKEMQTPYGENTINRATEAQIAYAEDQGYPVWGISDCFDLEDGPYVQRGAPPRGSGNSLDDEDDGLITPHASAMALITAYASDAIANLQALKDNYPDLYDADYGFKDSVNVITNKISYRFGTLDQEWIFLSLMNYLNATVWNYFYEDEGVQRTHIEMYAPSEFQKGMSYAAWWQGQYSTPSADQSLLNLTATGAKWLALIVTGYQETITSTVITYTLPRTPTDADLMHVITQAHNLGMKVMLKPHLDLNNDPAHWRGQIGIAFTTETEWEAWFASYRDFIAHYASLAQANGVEQFCVGTELLGTTGREADWRQVIGDVRGLFSGPITYASNHSGEETSIQWWDAVDYIGVDAYYPLTAKNDPTLAELKAAWVTPTLALENLSKQHNRPIIFTEIGYRSVDGANQHPWEWQAGGTVDLQEQANCYRAALETFWGKPWFRGIYWWYWSTDPNQGGASDDDYTPHNKPAELILRAYYAPFRVYLPLSLGTCTRR
jgi:exo-beta-1,3-glucanase (GH17 family)